MLPKEEKVLKVGRILDRLSCKREEKRKRRDFASIIRDGPNVILIALTGYSIFTVPRNFGHFTVRVHLMTIMRSIDTEKTNLK